MDGTIGIAEFDSQSLQLLMDNIDNMSHDNNAINLEDPVATNHQKKVHDDLESTALNEYYPTDPGMGHIHKDRRDNITSQSGRPVNSGHSGRPRNYVPYGENDQGQDCRDSSPGHSGHSGHSGNPRNYVPYDDNDQGQDRRAGHSGHSGHSGNPRNYVPYGENTDQGRDRCPVNSGHSGHSGNPRNYVPYDENTDQGQDRRAGHSGHSGRPRNYVPYDENNDRHDRRPVNSGHRGSHDRSRQSGHHGHVSPVQARNFSHRHDRDYENQSHDRSRNNDERRTMEPDKFSEYVAKFYDRKIIVRQPAQLPIYKWIRCFNNWLKNAVIDMAIQDFRASERPDKLSVVDLACGAGGDLGKYIGRNIDLYIGVDISQASVDEALRRFDQLSNRDHRPADYSAIIVQADLTEPIHYDIPEGSFQIAIMNFAMHYFFESEDSLNTLFGTVSSLLQVGGIFAGTMMDAGIVLRRVLQKSTNSHGFRRESYDRTSRTYNQQQSFMLSNALHAFRFQWHAYDSLTKTAMVQKFGIKYEFIMGTPRPKTNDRQRSEKSQVLQGWCTEFVAFWPVMKDTAARHGLKLIHFQNSHDFFYDSLNSETQKANMTMFGLCSKEMPSKDEWSTAQLTATFMFEKIEQSVQTSV